MPPVLSIINFLVLSVSIISDFLNLLLRLIQFDLNKLYVNESLLTVSNVPKKEGMNISTVMHIE